MLVVDGILELLQNGEWHGVGELVERSGVGRRKVDLVVDFLCGFGFLECDVKVRRVRLSPALLVFLRRVEDLERGEGRVGRGKKVVTRGLVGFLRVVGFGLVRGLAR